MGVIADFKKFAMRGNLIDLAIGFTVGAAFSTIAKSLVNDIIMPPVGMLLGQSDFSDLFWLLKEGPNAGGPYVTLADAQSAGAVTVNYGVFVNNLLAFVLVTIAMFAIIRIVNVAEESLEAQFGDPPKTGDPANKKCPYCLSTVPFRATRCSACTSHLNNTGGDDDTIEAASPPPG